MKFPEDFLNTFLTMAKFTKQQIARQDFVDNQIFGLINSLLPAKKQIEWDIETIGVIRDAICEQVVDKKIMNEMKFYPFIKI